MNKYDGEHTLEQFLENENIKADRFALAAISYIFKAFGDSIRSKEYWPWGEKVNFSWDNEKDTISGDKIQDALDKSNWTTYGNLSDLTRAMLCLKEAQVRSNKEETKKIKSNNSHTIKDLTRRLERLSLANKSINKMINGVSGTITNTMENLNNI